MAVGRVRGGKGPQGSSGAGGSQGSGSTDKAGSTSGVSSAFAGRVGGPQGSGATSAAQGSGEVVGLGTKAVDPLSSRAQALAQELKLGKISKEEARKQLFAEAASYATKKKLRINSRKLEETVRNKANSDPNLIRLVDQILSKG